MNELARAAGPIACGGLALLLVGRDRAARLAGLALVLLGSALLAAYLAPSGHHRAYAAAAVGGIVLAVAGALLFRRVPWALAVLALACAPARLPIHVAGADANLLVPLYVVVAGAVVALAWELVTGEVGGRELGPLALPLAAYVAWVGVSLLWSGDLRQGSIAVLFFYVPFGLLALCLARLPWSARAVRLLCGQLVLMGVLFAAVGIAQYGAHWLFWNRKLIVGNAYQPLFRVNSIFYDPSIYGRFLAVAIVVALAVLLLGVSARVGWTLVGAIAVTWVGLLFSFSQSSFVALGAGVLAAAIGQGQWRRRVVGAAALVGAVLVVVAWAPSASVNDASSGRFRLVTRGIVLGATHPAGVGVGSFQRAYGKRYHLRGTRPKAAASHTTPVTVFAEEGFPGIALFAWLLWVAFVPTFVRADSRTRIVATLGALVILVHSLGYNALFEDPLFWGLLALAFLARRAEEPG